MWKESRTKSLSRRGFLRAAVGAGALTVTGGGRKAVKELIPYVNASQETIPGTWTYYPTTCRECPAGCGMHVAHRDGRVTKVEGNPQHPLNSGRLCPRGQSSLQGLYDPDRANRVIRRGRDGITNEATWDDAIRSIAERLRLKSGRAIVVSGLETGALLDVMQRFTRAFGGDKVLLYEAFNYEAVRQAHADVFGAPVIPRYRLDSSDFIISFGADFLETWISPVEFARQFRVFHSWRDTHLGRFAYVGPRLSMTAANADDVLLVPPGDELYVALLMLRNVMDSGSARNDLSAFRPHIDQTLARFGGRDGIDTGLVARLAKRFVEAPQSVALAGAVGSNSIQTHDTAMAAALLNYAAGRVGRTVDFSQPHALSNTSSHEDVSRTLAGLTQTDTLIIHRTNPAFSFPKAAEQILNAGTVVYLGTMNNETAHLADWVLPIDYPLESWGDYEPYAGIHDLLQPTMRRLYDSRGAGDVFMQLAAGAGTILEPEGTSAAATFEEWVAIRRGQLYQRVGGTRSLNQFREDALRAGVIEEAIAPTTLQVQPATVTFTAPPPNRQAVQLWLWPSIMLFDGRTANRGWLQEAPDPMTQITWGNWIDIHPKQALRLGLSQDDVVELATPSGQVQAPIRITEDVAEGAVALSYGQGHSRFGRNADGVGVNAFALSPAAPGGVDFGEVAIKRVGPRRRPTYTSPTQSQYHRAILQIVDSTRLQKMKAGDGDHLVMPLPEGYDPQRDLYPSHEYKEHRWAMVIDLQQCIGCGACAIACYAENNIPVVGKESVARGLEMAWLKVVPYRHEEDASRMSWLPLPCQHCDAAPCEPVCPVYAAVHNNEGLNAQIYNRCIGTRYCSNNCPYKVRRFNWKNIHWETPLDVQLNPEVTVRSRGVMEKCSFCVQRIRLAEYQAKIQGRTLKDGDIQTACQQTCPGDVFVFGDLLDPDSRVTRLTREDPRRYHVLEELNTKPAITYLRRIVQDKPV